MENKEIQNEQTEEVVTKSNPLIDFFKNKTHLYIGIAALAAVLVAVIVAIFACGGNNNAGAGNGGEVGGETDGNGENDENGETGGESSALAYKDATELLTTIWNEVPEIINDGGTPDITEDDLNKFITYEGQVYHNFVGGFTLDGDQVEGAPGEFMLDGDMINSALGYPADKIDSIDDAASIMFGMNQNTFTCGAYHLVEGADAAEIANAIEQSIQGRWWMCGFPDSVVIIKLPGDYLISIFGHTIVDTFVDIVLNTIDGAEVVINNPIQ